MYAHTYTYTYTVKRRENGRNVTLFRQGLCGQRHGLAMNWVDRPRTSADERDVGPDPPSS